MPSVSVFGWMDGWIGGCASDERCFRLKRAVGVFGNWICYPVQQNAFYILPLTHTSPTLLSLLIHVKRKTFFNQMDFALKKTHSKIKYVAKKSYFDFSCDIFY